MYVWVPKTLGIFRRPHLKKGLQNSGSKAKACGRGKLLIHWRKVGGILSKRQIDPRL